MTQNNRNLDEGKIRGGFVWGALIGVIVALLRGPRFNLSRHVDDTRDKLSDVGDSLLSTIDAAIPKDPLEESIAEGKAAARRRQEALRLQEPDEG